MLIWEYFLSRNNQGKIEQKDGIMKTIQALQNNPFEWLDSDSAINLDNKFLFEHSGDKKLSPLFNRMILLEEQAAGETISAVNRLAKLIIQTYTDKWNKLYSAIISSNYNPLENYNMEQVETPDITREKDSKTKTKLTTSSSGDSSTGVYGFNSGVPVPTDENDASSEVTVEGADTDNGTHEEETETGTRELTRHGNIGVTTSQQMLLSEVDLREKINFYNIILNDISKMLCLDIY